MEGYLLDEFGDLDLDAVTPDLIDAYKERLIAEGKLSTRTIVRHLTVLHGIFKRAKRALGSPRTRPRPIWSSGRRSSTRASSTPSTATRSSCWRARQPTTQDAALYRVAAYTGLRQGELLALRWADVDFVGGLLHVRRNFTGRREKVPKGKRVRSVPMMPGVVDALARLKERDALHRRRRPRVLPRRRAPRPLRAPSSLLRRARSGGAAAHPVP